MSGQTFTPVPAQPPPPEVRRRMNGERLTGMTIIALMALLGIGIAWFLWSSWDIEFVEKYGPNYLSGLWITVQLVSISVVLGAMVSLPVAMGRMSSNPAARPLAFAYVYFFRGTPLLAQIFLVYYGAGVFVNELKSVGLWTFFRDPWNCAVFTFTLNTAAYQAEILRGAIQSVPRGQWEAASALGLGRFQTFRKIILPQALIVALRPYGNEIILMIKGSAIVAIITVLDLMGETRRAFSRTYDFQTYIWAAIFYLLIVETLRNLWDRLEQRLTRHLKREG
ncbi:MAG: ABC transporter permease [Minwuia sp.]|uniref:ABC transporter permease n=1 Tax=Minwuia sp. TaxID=2493630 RepID=UPI003A83C5E3